MFVIKDKVFNVTIEQKRIKNIYIRVEEDNIRVTAPKYVPKYEIYNFLESKRDWIYKTYIRSQIRKQITMKYNGGDTFYIYGKKYKLVKEIGKKSVSVTNDTIYLTYKDEEGGIDFLYKYLSSYLLKKAEEYVDKYIYMIQDYGYYLKPYLNAKLMTSKWGVCYTRSNKINISSYLIHYPIYCLEYIIVHELTHFIVPNHSRRFYEIVVANMPNYKEAEKALKQWKHLHCICSWKKRCKRLKLYIDWSTL